MIGTSDPDASRVEFRPARPEEYPCVLALWGVVWGEGPYFRSYLEGDPWLREQYCLVAVVDGRIVSAVQICRRPMRMGSRELTFGGIANVATLPEYRKRGYSGELLARCVRVMDEERFDFSALGTGIHSHYERHGWFRVPVPSSLLAFDVERPLPEADPDIQPLAAPQWIDEAPPVYAAFNSRLPLHFDRSIEYWNGWLRIRSQEWGVGRSILIGLRREGMLDGYLIGSVPDEPNGAGRVHEIAAIQPEQIPALLKAAARIARVEGASCMVLRIPNLSSYESDLAELGTVTRRVSNGTMIRGFSASVEDLDEIVRLQSEGLVTWWGPDDF